MNSHIEATFIKLLLQEALCGDDDIDNIFWRKKTKPISKEEILAKYKELKDIERDRLEFEKANRKGYFQKLISLLDSKKIHIYNYRQGLATFSVIISLIFVD